MILGTKARYAVMALVDLVKHCDGKPMPLSEIAERQEISLAYLEQIFPKLRKAGLVRAIRGPGGGYLLANHASQISILKIVNAVDESLKMTRCGDELTSSCLSDGKKRCVTHSLWVGLGKNIENYLSAISLQDVCEQAMRADKKRRHYDDRVNMVAVG